MALLGLEIPTDVSNKLRKLDVPGSRDLSDHLTMFYFEQRLTPKNIAKISEGLSDLIEKTKPFTCSIKQLTSFPKGDDGVPIKGDVVSKELLKLRSDIAKILDKNNIKFSKKFPDFKPHVTLSYSDKKFDKLKIDPIVWTNSTIIIWGGNYREPGIETKIYLGKKCAFSQLSIVANHYDAILRK